MTAKTPAERQAAFRQRKAAAGETEVRGIFAPPDMHRAIKAAAAKVRRKIKSEAKLEREALSAWCAPGQSISDMLRQAAERDK